MSAIEQVRALLGKPIRVVLSDGRVVEGSLLCVDKDMNFVLGEAHEFHGVDNAALFDPACAVMRSIGSATIPGAHVSRVLSMSSSQE